MRSRMDVMSLAKLLTQAAEAWNHDGPPYLGERILQLTRELRAMCDDVELRLTDPDAWERKMESEVDTGEMETVR